MVCNPRTEQLEPHPLLPRPKLAISTFVDDNLAGSTSASPGSARLEEIVKVVEALGWDLPLDHVGFPAQVVTSGAS